MLHPSITSRRIDTLFRIALEKGAWGGKALGAGGGGCLLFLCPEEKVHAVQEGLLGKKVEFLPFRFAKKGFQRVSREY